MCFAHSLGFFRRCFSSHNSQGVSIHSNFFLRTWYDQWSAHSNSVLTFPNMGRGEGAGGGPLPYGKCHEKESAMTIKSVTAYRIICNFTRWYSICLMFDEAKPIWLHLNEPKDLLKFVSASNSNCHNSTSPFQFTLIIIVDFSWRSTISNMYFSFKGT